MIHKHTDIAEFQDRFFTHLHNVFAADCWRFSPDDIGWILENGSTDDSTVLLPFLKSFAESVKPENFIKVADDVNIATVEIQADDFVANFNTKLNSDREFRIAFVCNALKNCFDSCACTEEFEQKFYELVDLLNNRIGRYDLSRMPLIVD